ncbi:MULTISPECIES: hypothetical protein [Comamonas]|uniref:Uncharacterized protein n=1 Tax=Comamonas squillarum TaxID=2977320 RepID=A0ABY6A5K7_9BURK|nr:MULTISPECIES: hypothetical protein [Comamonas]UXC20387.1 hypothetical protein N4T19_09855 [Comamonas sp. PR12]
MLDSDRCASVGQFIEVWYRYFTNMVHMKLKFHAPARQSKQRAIYLGIGEQGGGGGFLKARVQLAAAPAA